MSSPGIDPLPPTHAIVTLAVIPGASSHESFVSTKATAVPPVGVPRHDIGDRCTGRIALTGSDEHGGDHTVNRTLDVIYLLACIKLGAEGPGRGKQTLHPRRGHRPSRPSLPLSSNRTDNAMERTHDSASPGRDAGDRLTHSNALSGRYENVGDSPGRGGERHMPFAGKDQHTVRPECSFPRRRICSTQ